jgi:hypothetical protein
LRGAALIVGDPPLISPIEDLILSQTERERAEDSVRKLIQSYRRTL